MLIAASTLITSLKTNTRRNNSEAASDGSYDGWADDLPHLEVRPVLRVARLCVELGRDVGPGQLARGHGSPEPALDHLAAGVDML